MPDPDRLLRTLRRAVEAFDATPGRTGRTVRLESAEDVLVAGDLHGNTENFRRLLAHAQLGSHRNRHLVLQELVHGPFQYPAGGDKSHQLLDLLAALKCEYPFQVHFLLGNHELAQWQDEWIVKADVELTAAFREGIETAYGARALEIYEAYVLLFSRAALAVRTPNRVFLSHSLPSARRLAAFDPKLLDTEAIEQQHLGLGGAIHALVWGRDTSQQNAEKFLRMVDAHLLVTGHIPCEEGFDSPNDRQLILDCMAAPAAYCLFPVTRPLSHQELLSFVRVL